jgi:nucleoside-diphosphate-sugar epimerase
MLTHILQAGSPAALTSFMPEPSAPSLDDLLLDGMDAAATAAAAVARSQAHQHQQQQLRAEGLPPARAPLPKSIPTHAPPPPPIAPAAPSSLSVNTADAVSSAAEPEDGSTDDTSTVPAPAAVDPPLSPKTTKLLRRIRRREEELEALALENALLKEANRRANEERVVREQEKRVEARRRSDEEAAWQTRVEELQQRVQELTPQDDAQGGRHDPIECARTANELRELLQLREEQLELINLDRFKLYEEIETWKAGMEKLASLHGSYSPSAQPLVSAAEHAWHPKQQPQQQTSPQSREEADADGEKAKPAEGPEATEEQKQPPQPSPGAANEAPRRSSSALLASFLPGPIAALLTSSSKNSTDSGGKGGAPSASAQSAPTAAAGGVSFSPASSPTSSSSSSSSSLLASSAAAGAREPVLEEVWQNEHRHPFFGWSKTSSAFLRHPFSDESGATAREFEKVTLPPGWVWDGAWQLDRGEWDAPEHNARAAKTKATAAVPASSSSPSSSSSSSSNTDPAGWRYSIALRLFAWHSSAGRLDTVRRRRWLRRRVFVGVEATEAMLNNAFAAIAAAHALPDGVAKAAAAVAAGIITESEQEASSSSTGGVSGEAEGGAPAAKCDAASLAALAAAYSSSDPRDSFSMFTSVAPPEVAASASGGGGGASGTNGGTATPESQGARALAALLQLGNSASKSDSPVAVSSDASASAASVSGTAVTSSATSSSSSASLTSTVASYIAAPAVNLGAYLASTRLSSWVGGGGGGSNGGNSGKRSGSADGTPVAEMRPRVSRDEEDVDDSRSRSVSPAPPSSSPSPVCSYCPNRSRTALQYVSPQTGFVLPLSSYCQRHYHQSQRWIAEQFQRVGPLSEHEHHMRDKARSTLPPTMCAYCDSTDSWPVQLLHLGAPIPDSVLSTSDAPGAAAAASSASSSASSSTVCEVLDSHDIQRFCDMHLPIFLKLVSQFQPRDESPPPPGADEEGEEEEEREADTEGEQHADGATSAAASSSSSSSSPPRPRVLILGANGLIGRHCYHALRARCDVTLLDRTVGHDERNRFAAEGVATPTAGQQKQQQQEEEEKSAPEDLSLPESEMIQMDLLSQVSEFEALLARLQPRVVLHLANALESAPLESIEANRQVDALVLRTCVAQGIAVVAASSIRMYYGSVMRSSLLSRVFLRDASAVIGASDQLDARSTLRNDEESVALYTPPEQRAQAFAYVQGKMAMEEQAIALVQAAAASSSSTPSSEATIVAVRFGWVTVRPAEEQEAETANQKVTLGTGGSSSSASADASHVSISELSVLLRAADLRSFVSRVVDAVVEGRVKGARIFTAVSEHPQRWVNLKQEEKELAWHPLPLLH